MKNLAVFASGSGTNIKAINPFREAITSILTRNVQRWSCEFLWPP